jgi:hypothetical protein
MKHKHYDCIVAWAEGKQIQCNNPDRDGSEDWEDEAEPCWYNFCDYRIKPEPKPDIVKIFYLESHPFLGLRFSEEVTPIKDKTKRISCTFDSITGKLKAAEVI